MLKALELVMTGSGCFSVEVQLGRLLVNSLDSDNGYSKLSKLLSQLKFWLRLFDVLKFVTTPLEELDEA